jgi:hypothetical protein
VILLTVATAGCGGDTTEEPATTHVAAEETYSDETDAVTVPDVIGEDGADAVDTLESEGLYVSFSEDDGRDPSGCTVEDQDETGEVDAETEVILTLDCRQVDWENQEGEDWDLFNEAYATGWDEGCDEAFTNSPDGSLYYDEEEFTSTDCQLNNPGDATSSDIPPDVPDDPESEGEDLGITDGCTSAFEDLSYDGSLYYGDEAFDSRYCP